MSWILTRILGMLSGASHVALPVIIMGYLALRNTPFWKSVQKARQRFGWFGAWLIAFSGLLGSLYYSEIVGLEPCTLCWIQRVLLYPLVLLIPVARYTGNRPLKSLSFAFSGVGLAVALYHYYTQMVNHAALCGPEGVSCATIYILEFGYITMPLMTATAFAYMLLLYGGTHNGTPSQSIAHSRENQR